jgi:hypothetical protein
MAERKTGLDHTEIPGDRVQLNIVVHESIPRILGIIAELGGTTMRAVAILAFEKIIAENADELKNFYEQRSRLIDEEAAKELALFKWIEQERASQKDTIE